MSKVVMVNGDSYGNIRNPLGESDINREIHVFNGVQTENVKLITK